VRTIRSAMAIGLLCVPTVLRAAEDHETGLSSIIARGSERPIVFDAERPDAGDILAAIAGVDSFPVGCATPLSLLLARPETPLPASLQQAAALITARPALDSEKISVVHDGRFAIHYAGVLSSSGLMSIDRDRNGVPDLVDRIAEALVAARSSLVARFGFPPPLPEGERLDVFVAGLGRGLEGYAVPRLEGGAAAAGGVVVRQPFVILDAGLSADRVMPATLHQIAHLSLLSLSPRAPIYWTEGTASYLTLLATGDLRAHDAALRARLLSPASGLASDGLLLMEGGLLWPQFLAESAGDPSIVRQIWQETAAQGPDPLAAIDTVLRRSGRSLAEASREYAAWNLFTGDRDDGQHYASGRFFPTSSLPAAGPDAPVRFEPADPVEPLGSTAFRLPGDGRRGTIDFEISAEGGHPGADLLVFYRPWGPQPVLVPVLFDAAGSGRVSVPWADAREVWIVLRNDALPGGGGARFEARALPDPYAPYDLASFTASEMGGSMLLEWTTASEKGLAAWNIYRAETPGGPFTRLNSVAVPAMGDSASDTGYIFLDDIARSGRRYYYVLEGLTDLGLPQRSHVVSGRIAAVR